MTILILAVLFGHAQPTLYTDNNISCDYYFWETTPNKAQLTAEVLWEPGYIGWTTEYSSIWPKGSDTKCSLSITLSHFASISGNNKGPITNFSLIFQKAINLYFYLLKLPFTHWNKWLTFTRNLTLKIG